MVGEYLVKVSYPKIHTCLVVSDGKEGWFDRSVDLSMKRGWGVIPISICGAGAFVSLFDGEVA